MTRRLLSFYEYSCYFSQVGFMFSFRLWEIPYVSSWFVINNWETSNSRDTWDQNDENCLSLHEWIPTARTTHAHAKRNSFSSSSSYKTVITQGADIAWSNAAYHLWTMNLKFIIHIEILGHKWYVHTAILRETTVLISMNLSYLMPLDVAFWTFWPLHVSEGRRNSLLMW